MRAVVVIALLAACNGFDPLAQPAEAPRPFADAGTGSSYPLGSTVTLDGSRSFDLAGHSMTFRWSVVQSPSGSTAMPANPDATVTTFVPDQLGTYRLKLDVTDTTLATDSSEVRIVATGAITAIDAGSDLAGQWLTSVQLAGSVTTVPGKLATYTWGFVSVPSGSTASLSDNTLHPTFVPDATGTYVAELTARVGDEVRTDTVTVTVTATGIPIGTDITAYVYSQAVDRIFYVHDVGDAEVVKFDPATGNHAALDVGAFTPRSLSIDAIGNYLVVGGLGKVATVTLNTLAVGSVRDAPGCTAAHVSASQASIIVYCFPADGSVEPISTVFMQTGQVTQTPSLVRFPDVAIDEADNIYMVDAATPQFYVLQADSATVFTSPETHTTLTGVAPPVIAAGANQPYAVTGNGLALDTGGGVRFDLHTPMEQGGFSGGVRGELAVVAGTQLKVFNTFGTVMTPPLVLSAVIPTVDGMTPTTKLVAYSHDEHRLIIVAGTAEGDVVYSVPR